MPDVTAVHFGASTDANLDASMARYGQAIIAIRRQRLVDGGTVAPIRRYDEFPDDAHRGLIHPAGMLPMRFTKLTTRQRECLRLYHQRYRIKEIAQALGISENTASGYLTEAAAILDAGGRRAAAAALAAFENDHPDERGRFSTGHHGATPTEPVRQSATLSSPSRSPDPPGVVAVDDMVAPAIAASVPSSKPASVLPFADHLFPRGRSQAGDRGASPPQDDGHHRNSAARPKHDRRAYPPGQAWVPLRQGDGNDLTVTRRFVWLGIITFLLVSSFGIFAFFIRTVSDLARGFAS